MERWVWVAYFDMLGIRYWGRRWCIVDGDCRDERGEEEEDELHGGWIRARDLFDKD
jgi:hypothetical protein